MFKITRRRIGYLLLLLSAILICGALATGQYFKERWFRDTPNTLAIRGEPDAIPFRWGSSKHGSYVEPQSSISVPVKIKGFDTTFHMQFDTGVASSFVRSEALEKLASRGLEIELIERNNQTIVKNFEFLVGGASVVLTNGRVARRKANIDWDDPNATNLIGTIGTDFLDQRICEIDFPAEEIRLHKSRPLRRNVPYTPFDFKGRRIVLPVKLNGRKDNVLWDSGCSAFGLLTSRYYYERLTDDGAKELSYNANRHGDPVFVHHRESDMTIAFGSTEVPIQRISYANLYGTAQLVFGRFSKLVGFVGFIGNKPFLECNLVIDAKANEFQLIPSTSTLNDKPPFTGSAP